jgi:hypothetical protein
MARDTVRVARGERGREDNGDVRLGYDEALVGSGADDAAEIVIDPSEREHNPFLGTEDENWDLPEDQRTKERQQTDDRTDQDRTREQQEQRDDRRQEVGDEDDVRLAYDEDAGGERTSRRVRRNKSRRAAVDHRDQVIDSLRGELLETKQMVANLYGGQFNLSARDVDQRIQYHQNALDRADQEIANAIKESDGNTAVALQRERDKIMQALWQLQTYRRGIEDQARQMLGGGGQPDQQQPQYTPEQQAIINRQEGEYERMRDVFLDRYTWFDPDTGNDPDHDFVRRLDREVVADGYMRHTKAFWHQMEERMMGAGFRPEGGRPAGGFREDTDDDNFSTRRDFQSRRLNGGGSSNGRGRSLPPTGAVRSISRPGGMERGFELSEIQLDMLQQEGLLEGNLSKEEQAKKSRIIDKWRRGSQQLARSRG